MNILLVILLILFGVGLLVAELFLIPGFGIAGVFGFLSLAGSVGLAYWKLPPTYPWAGHITLAACVVLTAVAVYAFLRSRSLEKMSLDTTIDSKVDMPKPGKHLREMEQDNK